MSTRSCPEWPELLDRAPDLHFKHYTADELQLAADIVVALGPGVRLSEIEVCADTQRNVFYAAHTDPRLADAQPQLLAGAGQLDGGNRIPVSGSWHTGTGDTPIPAWIRSPM
jgi:hypothetical protein